VDQQALGHRLARYQVAFARAPELAPELQQAAALKQRVLATGQEEAVDLTFALHTGEQRDYHVTMCPLPQVDGAVHVLTVGTDVTALKQAQRAATAAAQAQENFLATMSHEIRTPLNGVLGMAGLLAKTPLTAEQCRYLDVVQHAGRHLLALLNDVLDMAKIRSGQLHLEAVPVDLAHVLRAAAQTLAWQAQAKGLALEVVGFAEAPPRVHTDPMRLNQVLLNLLGNAVKFTERGQVTLHAAVRAETADRLCVHFQVRDTGPGVAPAAQEHIFDAFAQAADDTTRRFGGTGLGLAISSRLVAQLGGHLVLCSEAGRGSTFAFTVAFAKCPGPEVAVGPAPEGGAPSLRGWRALVVDDNAWNQELARAVLEQHGVVVDATASAAGALALFEQRRYDVVLMDVHMPGMNGLEATAYLRRHPDPDRAATPVLALTADAFPAQHASYRAAGMSDVLAKPFTEAELLAKLVSVARKQPHL
jgi:signal transduction histidine kinase/CheY-like chemotaxis protein